jgi:hypothetical protein
MPGRTNNNSTAPSQVQSTDWERVWAEVSFDAGVVEEDVAISEAGLEEGVIFSNTERPTFVRYGRPMPIVTSSLRRRLQDMAESVAVENEQPNPARHLNRSQREMMHKPAKDKKRVCEVIIDDILDI